MKIVVLFLILGFSCCYSAEKAKYDFTRDWFSLNIKNWTRILGDLKDKKNISYLEIGVWEGRSFFWMLDNILTDSSSKAVAIDIFPEKVYPIFKKNLEKSGHKNRVKIVRDYSFNALKKMNQKFDIIYIDGSHYAKNVLEDIVLTWPLLKENGILILDDYKMGENNLPETLKPYVAIDAFIKAYRSELTILLSAWQVIVRKEKYRCKGPFDNFVVTIGNYCFFWNHYGIKDAKYGLYDFSGKQIELTSKQHDDLQKYLVKIKAGADFKYPKSFTGTPKELLKFLDSLK